MNMANGKTWNINTPVMDEGNLEKIDLKSWLTHHEEDDLLTQFYIVGDELIEEDCYRLDAASGKLERCRIEGCNFEKASFVDVVFDHCDFTNSNFSEAYFSRCQFLDCRCMGMDLHEAMLKHVMMSECQFTYANLSGVLLEKVAMKTCDLTDAACVEAKVKGWEARGCKFVKTNFFHTSLRGFDFSENELSDIIVSDSMEELRGCKISALQSLEAAHLLGMKVV